MNYATKAEFYKQGLLKGAIEASEVITWADEVIVEAPKTEDWMLEISTSGPDERMKVISQLGTVKGVVDQTELSGLLKARGLA
jgi:hypothetical protein